MLLADLGTKSLSNERPMRIVLLALIALVSFPAGLNAGLTTISTVSNTNQAQGGFGNPGTASYGQTFVLPTLNPPHTMLVLTSFTFPISRTGTNSFDFQFYVAQWDGNKVQGNVLYSSPVANISSATKTDFTFTPNLTLTAGTTYIAFASTSKQSTLTSGNEGAAQFELAPNSAYAGGQFFFLDNGQDAGRWSTDNWGALNNDLGFTATFSAVPEPSSLVLVGLAALAATARRRRR